MFADLVCRPPREDLDAAEYCSLYRLYIQSFDNVFGGSDGLFRRGVAGVVGSGGQRCVVYDAPDGAVGCSARAGLGVTGLVGEGGKSDESRGGGRETSGLGSGVSAQVGCDGDGCGGFGEAGAAPGDDVETVCVEDNGGAAYVEVHGPNWQRNRQWKEKKKQSRARRVGVPEWRRTASAVPSLTGSVKTVSTECAEEIEARRTLAARRVAENKVATAMAEHRLVSLADVDKTEALKRLAVVRVEERVNTIRAKSQASFKKCGSALESVGSAASAGEFAWKQEVRKREALVVERDYLKEQLQEMLKHASFEARQAVANLPEPYIPTEEEIELEDEDIAPWMSREEMGLEAARYMHG